MKKTLYLLLLLTLGCQAKTETKPTFGIVIHGGAGTILKENMTAEKEAAYRQVLSEAKIGRASCRERV